MNSQRKSLSWKHHVNICRRTLLLYQSEMTCFCFEGQTLDFRCAPAELCPPPRLGTSGKPAVQRTEAATRGRHNTHFRESITCTMSKRANKDNHKSGVEQKYHFERLIISNFAVIWCYICNSVHNDASWLVDLLQLFSGNKSRSCKYNHLRAGLSSQKAFSVFGDCLREGSCWLRRRSRAWRFKCVTVEMCRFP